jgi:hypothetical protein
MQVARIHPLTTFVLGSILAPALASAQGSSFETVYFAQPNNRILKVVEFQLPNGPGSTEAVVFERGTHFQGLVVRQDNLIFVANTTQQGSILVCDPESGECQRVVGFEKAEGLDIGTSTGALVAVGDDNEVVKLDPTGCSQTFDSPGCRPGGYQRGIARRSLPAVQKVADVKFTRISRGPFVQGDIAILSEAPPKLLKLSDFGASPTVVLSDIKFNGKRRTPTGLAFNSAGDALIVTKDGLLLRYPGGNGSPELFAPLGGPGAKIAVGVQGPELQERIFVTVQSGQVLCFEAGGASCGKVSRLSAPEGIGIATGAFQPTPVGANVSQILNLGLRTEWEQILVDGVSVALCRQILETRPAGSPDPLYLCDPSKTYDGFVCEAGSRPFVDLGLPNVIPPHVRAYRTGTSASNPTGPETFLVCTMDTSADFKGIIRDHVGIPLDLTEHVTTWIGYDFHELCPEPAVFYSPGIGDPLPVEGNDFFDVTLACNHPLGGTWGRSTYLFGSRSTETPCEEADFKLTNLDLTLGGASIGGACSVGAPSPGGIPSGSTEAKMDAAFAAAGLGSRGDWSLVSESAGTFGGAGNGYLVGGGTVEVRVKNAAFNHEVGFASSSSGTLTSIVPNSGAALPGATFPFSPAEDGYVLYFKNLDGDFQGQKVFTDGVSDSSALGIAVYQNNADTTRFALFFDDGGGAPDEDFDDLVVTATGAVGTACQLAIALDHARSSFDAAACTPGSFGDTVEALEDEFIDVLHANPGDFPATGNLAAELEARALSLIFILTDKMALQPTP